MTAVEFWRLELRLYAAMEAELVAARGERAFRRGLRERLERLAEAKREAS